MSIKGIGLFRDAMAGFEDCYALIGGSACDLLFANQGMNFRATKDLDLVVLANKSTEGFPQTLWNFIRSGGYQPWRGCDELMRFYRFVNPTSPAYPHMIELFARQPDFELSTDAEVTPLPFDEDVSSLSAILLDDDYYNILLDGLAKVEGVSVIDEAHLILLKMRAHIDLNDKAASGQHVNNADLKKHRKDVLHLLELVPNNLVLSLPERIEDDARRFISTVDDPSFRIDQLGLSMNRADIVSRLEHLCGI